MIFLATFVFVFYAIPYAIAMHKDDAVSCGVVKSTFHTREIELKISKALNFIGGLIC